MQEKNGKKEKMKMQEGWETVEGKQDGKRGGKKCIFKEEAEWRKNK